MVYSACSSLGAGHRKLFGMTLRADLSFSIIALSPMPELAL
jgi:hypothetical protein